MKWSACKHQDLGSLMGTRVIKRKEKERGGIGEVETVLLGACGLYNLAAAISSWPVCKHVSRKRGGWSLRRNSIQGGPLASILRVMHVWVCVHAHTQTHTHRVVDTHRLAVQASAITDHLTCAELSVWHCCMENFPADRRVRVSWPSFDLLFSSPCSLCGCPTCIHCLHWAFPQLHSRCTFSTDILQGYFANDSSSQRLPQQFSLFASCSLWD